MLDIKFIRENKTLIAEAAKKKRLDFNVEELLSADDDRIAILGKVEEKRALQNEASTKISSTTDPAERINLIDEMKIVKAELEKEEETLREVMKRWQMLMVQVPNVPDMSVPEGDSDEDNKEHSVWGDIPTFSYEPKDHISLMESLAMADFEKGAEVSGFRGYYLKGDGALLNFALWQYVLDLFARERGLQPMLVPSLVRRETLIGTGYLPQGEEDMYKTQDNDYLAGTGEVAAMSYYSDKILKKEDLPIKVLAFSPCFRREAGSHSKDTKGLIRVHEFFKFEQVVLCEANHEESVKFHEWLLENTEKLMQGLKIPYRVVVNCTGDLGLGQVKKYDIEAWVPSQNKYRETHSCSYFHDFQTRRLNIRYKDETGKTRFAHSLNNTAAAFPRLLVPLVENYQNEDGSITVPEVLKPYLGKDIIK